MKNKHNLILIGFDQHILFKNINFELIVHNNITIRKDRLKNSIGYCLVSKEMYSNNYFDDLLSRIDRLIFVSVL